MRRFVFLVGAVIALMASMAWGQSIFEVGPGSVISSAITLPDGSVAGPTGLTLSPSSTLTGPDASIWTASGLQFPTTSTLVLPDRTVVNPTGITMAAATTFRGPDASLWNSGGLLIGPGKQIALANGSSSAPSLTFSSQATAGWYRETTDDLRLVLSGSILALRAYKANASAGALSVPFGASTGYAVIGGRICTSTTSAATTGTSAQVLATCLLPPLALSVDGQGLKIKAWGRTAANGNSKVLELLFDVTVCGTLTSTVNNGTILAEATILRSGAATQECAGMGVSGAGTAHATSASPTADTTLPLTVSVRATTPTASGDFTFKGLTVEVIN